jgi:hypothetical protein
LFLDRNSKDEMLVWFMSYIQVRHSQIASLQ